MFSGLESPTHLLIVLIIVMLVFGSKRLPEIGRSLGSGIRGFKSAVSGEDEPAEEKLAQGAGTTSSTAPVETAPIEK